MNLISGSTKANATIAVMVTFTLSATIALANSMGQAENFIDRPGGDYHSYQSGTVRRFLRQQRRVSGLHLCLGYRHLLDEEQRARSTR
jgi:hypothetical protein